MPKDLTESRLSGSRLSDDTSGKRKEPIMFDVIIQNGKIVDGSGRRSYVADIGITGGRITAISPQLPTEVREVIDAAGCVVSPGFIDMHSHSDFTLLVCPEAESKVRQGVTTELVGNCGGSPAPVPAERFDDFMQYMVGLGALYQKVLEPQDWRWKTLARFYQELADKGIAVNVAPLVGHSTLRCGAMGYEAGPPSSDQLDRMKYVLARELDQGAFGMSSGLIYHPGAFADRDELAELARVVHSYGGIYTTHMRSEGKYLLEAIDEAIYVGEKSNVSVEISHLKSEMPANWGKAKTALGRIDRARGKGEPIDFDQYPYRAYQCGLLEIFPTWAKEKGAERMIEALKDRALRQQIIKDMTQPPYDWDNPMDGLNWDQVRLNGFSHEKNQDLEGLTAARIAEQLSLEPLEAVFRLFEEEQGRLSMIVFSMNEDEVIEIMRHPDGMIGSDGCAVAPYGPTGARKVHPRFYGTFPRILGRYVREKHALSLEQAVHKMTGLPARKLHFKNRGLLTEGYHADIVVFDENRIADSATFESPHQYAAGIRQVLVNGQLVVSNGEHTGRLPGMVLTRT
jgi:N-acyl-D-amino-acid deacylase